MFRQTVKKFRKHTNYPLPENWQDRKELVCSIMAQLQGPQEMLSPRRFISRKINLVRISVARQQNQYDKKWGRRGGRDRIKKERGEKRRGGRLSRKYVYIATRTRRKVKLSLLTCLRQSRRVATALRGPG